MIRTIMYALLIMAVFFGNQSFSQTTDFTPHGTQPGLSYGLEGGSKCHSCHAGYPNTPSYPSDEQNMPYNTWAGSMKAHATRDPLFWAAVDVANNDIPGVGDFCIRCHTPQGWMKGHVVKPAIDGAPLLDGANGCELTGDHTARGTETNDYTGVTCHFCHRVDENGPMGEAQLIGNANAWVDDEACPGGFGPCRKGPYKYPDNGTHNQPPHDWAYSSFIQKGEFCGSCHDVSSPEIEQNGMLTIARKLYHNGEETNTAMPIERTYSEWKQSLFSDLIYRDSMEFVISDEVPYLTKGESCQDCHMPNSDDPGARACSFDAPGGRTGELSQHRFAGGNSWMPQVLKSAYGDDLEMVEEGIKGMLDLSSSYALEMLQTQSAAMEIGAYSTVGNTMAVDVKVINLTGHKLPTGYPEGRRMWLHVIAKDGDKNVLFESGAYDLNTAILTEDSQIKIYESQQGIWNEQTNQCEIKDDDNNKLFHFALNNCILKDNRIPPLGFRGGTDIELMPRAANYPINPQTGIMANYDTTRYTFDVENASLPISFTATLKYQTASKEYIEFLDKEAVDNNFQSENLTCDRSWTVGPADQSRGAFMKTLWENNGKSAPVDMNIKNKILWKTE
ncbi:hypothetical protein [Marinicella rhabdoformis]|uniref:hypothetical protein n=1 Tax=Marinicella rhabdoformis TaxID=2580566 RepID=UPI001C552EEC|nr:hypothetical protein [Marinicella rhabdoformis]